MRHHDESHTARAGAALQWRSPWWAWQLASLGVSTAMAPAFLMSSALLFVDPRSDHPTFWWSLPAIVALSHAFAMVCVNQLHLRSPFAVRSALARRHAGIGAMTAATLFLLVGTTSGFLPEIAVAWPGTRGAALPSVTAASASTLMAAAFGLLSCAHSGALHALLCFDIGARTGNFARVLHAGHAWAPTIQSERTHHHVEHTIEQKRP